MNIRSLSRVVALAAVPSLVMPAIVHGQQADVEPVPVCIYGGQSFSEGAQICMQRNAMLTCSANGDKAVWKAEADRQSNARCLAAFIFERPVASAAAPRKLAYRARPRANAAPAPAAAPAEPRAGNCFTFNNRRFCE